MMAARKLLQDSQWERIKDILPGKAGDRGATAVDNRLFIEAVLWLLRTGAPWRDLPQELGRWHTVYMRWRKGGVWKRLFQAASADADLREVFIDSTTIRAHLHAAAASKKTARGHWADLAADGAPRST